ncbi:MAG: acetate--CoA ligase family protein [Alphaproteobacteria bacterium]
MRPQLRTNLLRLLKPRHVAVIGGRDAETVVGECERIGFSGPLWPVNPKRQDIRGRRCFPSVGDLPEAPDATFLAVPREAAIATVAELNAIGAGGVVCYTAGFGEIGGDGAAAEAQLLEAAGDLAVVGPNCYGLINYVNRLALWPFAHGGSCPGFGAAIITQSGMLSSDLTMSQRSVPFAYMISAGNQTVLRLEDFVDVLSDQTEVRAIGLHIEGLKDVARFEDAAMTALRRGVPIVALKTGRSAIGAELTVSHTGSLSGAAELYEALFDRLGVITVTNPAQLLETLKFLCIAGAPKGPRIAGLTCSGGGATMLADHAETIGLDFVQPSPATAEALRRQLPFTATVSNPLDYTTPIWGIPEKTAPVFRTFLADRYDAALIVQDYPAPGLDESKHYYLNDAASFVDAAAATGTPAAVCSTLPENMDAETRAFLVNRGVAPMQGIHECLNAIAGGAWYSRRRGAVLAHPPPSLDVRPALSRPAIMLDEAAAKARLSSAGVPVPPSRIAGSAAAPMTASELGFPVALKMLSERLPHKTEAGAVVLNLQSGEDIERAVTRMRRDVAAYDPSALSDRFLIEAMVGRPVAELMVNLRRDPQFGLAMTIASGGILVELIGDAVTVLLPAHRAELEAALGRLRLSRLLGGYRGAQGADRTAIVDALDLLARHVADTGHDIVEVEINPLFVLERGVSAVDVLMRVTAPIAEDA